MRGLKLLNGVFQKMAKAVASFTDAWIETYITREIQLRKVVASFTDAWIETSDPVASTFTDGRIFYRCVD